MNGSCAGGVSYVVADSKALTWVFELESAGVTRVPLRTGYASLIRLYRAVRSRDVVDGYASWDQRVRRSKSAVVLEGAEFRVGAGEVSRSGQVTTCVAREVVALRGNRAGAVRRVGRGV